MSRPPLVLLHGFADTPRTWDLVRPALERRFEVLAPALAGHMGGPPLPADPTADTVLDVLEDGLDEAGLDTAHLAGNSLGGWAALRLAERGRARSVVALNPAGGWGLGDASWRETVRGFLDLKAACAMAAPRADEVVATPLGRRRATARTTVRFEHLPADLLAHQLVGAARCDGLERMVEVALRDGYPLHAERIACPVRIVWGTADVLLPWPSAAERYRRELPHADWVVLDDVGHCPQLDVPVVAAELIAGVAG